MKDTLTKVALFMLFLGLVLPNQVSGQQYPEVPTQLPFGGINVRFDQSARSIIASDVKVLMINQKYWEEKLERALLYFPIIESIFIDEEIPMDFKYLAAQESSLVPDAVSTSNAVGFWQFKEDTAKELGLRVDRHVDERKNISSSTRAAAAYLKRSNKEFNNWVSSLYSYYQGFNGAKEKLPAAWTNAHDISVTGKTDRYVLRFFAYKIAFEAGLDRYRSKNPITLVEASAGKGRSLEEISAELKVSSSDLKNYNKWLRGNNIPTDKSYYVTVPVASSKVANVKESLAIVESDNTLASKYEYDDLGYPKLRKLENQPTGYNAHVRYEINGLRGILARGGDYANTLARAGGISVAKFRRYNDLDVKTPIVPGEVYYLVAKNKKAATRFHTVRPGETLQSISQMYGIRMKNLLNYNRILSKDYYLETGRELWLTQKRPASVKIKINEVPPATPRESTPQDDIEILAENTVNTTNDAATETATPAPEVEKKPETPASDIPRNASERRRYTPKIADKVEEPEASASQPVATNTQPSTTPEPVAKAAEPVKAASSKEKPTETVVARPNSRIVIVTDDERPKPYISKRGAATAAEKEDVKPVYSPTPSANARQPASTTAENPAIATSRTAKTSVDNAAAEYYTVEKGDTYYSVSRKYGVTVTELLDLNDLKISDKLLIGKRLLVKEGTDSGGTVAAATTVVTPVATTAPARPAASQNATHTVRKGETLSSISRRYGVSVQDIIKFNTLKSTGIQVGQKIKIPKK